MNEFKRGKHNFYVAVECFDINGYVESEGNLLLKTDSKHESRGSKQD